MGHPRGLRLGQPPTDQIVRAGPPTYGEPGPVLVNETQKTEFHIRKIS